LNAAENFESTAVDRDKPLPTTRPFQDPRRKLETKNSIFKKNNKKWRTLVKK
jgi:hypothetical protein